MRFRPSVPEKANDTQSTPGTAARIDSRIASRAKLKITRTTIPKKTMAFKESLVRSSMSRSFRKIVQTLAHVFINTDVFSGHERAPWKGAGDQPGVSEANPRTIAFKENAPRQGRGDWDFGSPHPCRCRGAYHCS